MENILVIDDELMICEAISSYLKKHGFNVFTANTGNDGLRILKEQEISFIILDLMLPDMSGEEICSIVRSQSRVPIIMLTAKTMEEDMINGLSIGADDYITKPFSLKNLYARIQAVSRRSLKDLGQLANVQAWNNSDLVIDYELVKVKKAGEEISLTPIEWKLLSLFSKYPNKVFTRDELIERVFDIDFDGYDRVIDTHIKNLRKKIEDDPKKPKYICTIHGMGYRFGGSKQ